MGRQIIKQPNGLYAEWSTVVDDIVVFDATREELIAERVEAAIEEITKSVNTICDKLDRKEKPYFNFTMTWEEALAERRKDAEPIVLSKPPS